MFSLCLILALLIGLIPAPVWAAQESIFQPASANGTYEVGNDVKVIDDGILPIADETIDIYLEIYGATEYGWEDEYSCQIDELDGDGYILYRRQDIVQNWEIFSRGSTSSSQYRINNLNTGEYKIELTAIPGYNAMPPIYFRLQFQNGSPSVFISNDEGETYETNAFEVTTKGDLQLCTYDAATTSLHFTCISLIGASMDVFKGGFAGISKTVSTINDNKQTIITNGGQTIYSGPGEKLSFTLLYNFGAMYWAESYDHEAPYDPYPLFLEDWCTNFEIDTSSIEMYLYIGYVLNTGEFKQKIRLPNESSLYMFEYGEGGFMFECNDLHKFEDYYDMDFMTYYKEKYGYFEGLESCDTILKISYSGWVSSYTGYDEIKNQVDARMGYYDITEDHDEVDGIYPIYKLDVAKIDSEYPAELDGSGFVLERWNDHLQQWEIMQPSYSTPFKWGKTFERICVGTYRLIETDAPPVQDWDYNQAFYAPGDITHFRLELINNGGDPLTDLLISDDGGQTYEHWNYYPVSNPDDLDMMLGTVPQIDIRLPVKNKKTFSDPPYQNDTMCEKSVMSMSEEFSSGYPTITDSRWAKSIMAKPNDELFFKLDYNFGFKLMTGSSNYNTAVLKINDIGQNLIVDQDSIEVYLCPYPQKDALVKLDDYLYTVLEGGCFLEINGLEYIFEMYGESEFASIIVLYKAKVVGSVDPASYDSSGLIANNSIQWQDFSHPDPQEGPSANVYAWRFLVEKAGERGHSLDPNTVKYELQEWDESSSSWIPYVESGVNGVNFTELESAPAIVSGKYRLIEKESPAQFQAFDPIYFEVKASFVEERTGILPDSIDYDVQVWFSNDEGITYNVPATALNTLPGLSDSTCMIDESTKAITLQIVDYLETDLTINKVDEDGEPLAGAEFGLEKKTDTSTWEAVSAFNSTDTSWSYAKLLNSEKFLQSVL